MSGLPSGTVTFLFTDIEGSTRLLRQLGERYVEVVGRHDRLVREACAGHGGREVNTQGDAFFVAFARARDAVAAAVRVQRALAAERWPDGADVRVRMGLHTGEPVVGGANYVGLGVHRAARICAAGHGGQILLSTATRELLEDGLQPEISFRDLGEWRLKDFDRPEHLFQVVVDGLPADFPPLASTALQPPPGDVVELPPELDAGTPLVGREADLDALGEQWRRAHGGTGRLVLIAGSRGMGKTRLVAELAGEVHRDRGAVRYASGAGTAEAALEVLASARVTRRPTLLVVEDVDRASDNVRAALGDLVGALQALPVLVVATAEEANGGSLPRPDQTIVLAPLDAHAVRAVVRLYAGEREDAEIPFQRLAETSGGVPLRVHRAAVEWARTLVAHRLAETASRIVAERPALRAAEDDLAASIVELHADRERAEPSAAIGESVICPFKGLASFDVDDAAVFFGRERLVAEMVARLTGAPLMGIVGPSGSGKSSVLRAGLLASLAVGVLPGSDGWALVLLRPGEHPMEALEQATADAPRRGRLVIAVDQFEEAFTACRDATERTAFVDALVASARDPRQRAVVLVAVRADFSGRCTAYPELAKLLGANQVLVGPMGTDELRRAIELPARRAGLHVEPELVDALVRDVGDEPGALPLLSTALLELWQHRDGRRLRHATYERIGGVLGAVPRLAEEAFGELDRDQQRIARSVLLRLAGEGSGGAVVRRRVALTELHGPNDEDLAVVLGVLTDRRLLTISANTVEVAHEALLREWPRLRGWLEQDAQGRRTQRHLADAARDWDERGRDPGDLYRGARLAVALEWRGAHEDELNSTERVFLDAGRAAAGRAHRRLRLALVGVVALLAITILGGLVAVHQRSTANTQARIADAQRISVQALAEGDLARSLLLARQGFALADSPITRGNLLAALSRSPAATRVIRGEGQPLTTIDLAPDGRTLVVGGNGGAEFLDAVTRRRIGTPATTGVSVQSVRFSPDGRRVAVVAYGPTGDARIELLDAHDHRRLTTLDLEIDPSFLGDVGNVVFSQDSRVVAADFGAIGPAGSLRRYLKGWDAGSGRVLGPPRPIGPCRCPRRALGGFIASGTRLLTSGADDGTTVIRRARTLRPVRRFPIGGNVADVSRDGRYAALASRDGAMRLLELRTGRSRRLAQPDLTAARFTTDSRRLLTAGRGGRLTVWDAARATPRATIALDAGDVRQLAISRDGRTTFTAGRDGNVIGWDLSGTRRLGRPFRVGPRAPTDLTAVTSASPVFAVAVGGSVDLYNSGAAAHELGIIVHDTADAATRATRVAITRDGRTMAAGTADGAIQFLDVRSGQPRGAPRFAHVDAVLALAFTPDGRWLATSGKEGAIYVWNVETQRPARLYKGLTGPATSLSVSPDGTRLAAMVVREDGTGELDILSIPRLAVLARAPARAGTHTQFSRDGKQLFHGDNAGLVWTLDTHTWRPRGSPLGEQSGAGSFALSADDRVLAITAADGATQLWDVPSRHPIGGTLPGVAGRHVRTAFVAGGTELVTLDENGRGFIWDVRPQSWARRACTLAGRPLTRAEWDEALPQRDYAPACADH
jgi:class 3 adenylate cyclase/WD40 repeat protein/energy-coupling factor transporter ATP-binding protein EcfA2